MIPLKDLNPQRSFPIVTLLLIVANVVVFVHQITLPPTAADAFIKTYALTPSHIQLALEGHRYTPVSYTHLDVYKRQLKRCEHFKHRS